MKKLNEDELQDVEVILLEHPELTREQAIKRLRNRKSQDALDKRPSSLDESILVLPEEAPENPYLVDRVKRARDKAALYFPEILIVALENGWSVSEITRELGWGRRRVENGLRDLKAFLRKELED